MNEKYNALFTPWKIGNVEIKNRIVQCSMGGTSLFGWMEPNHFDKEAAYFLLNRAQDGVGLILPGMQCIRDPLGIPGRKWLYQNDQMFKQLKEYMVEFHKTGAKLFIQLAAGMGRSMAINGWMTKLAKNNVLNKIASPIVDVQYICASASEVPNRWKEDVMSRPLTVKEIEDMVYAFGQTAKKLRAAGVDGVEIHAVHEGYLLDQFTMANWNHRTDKYGGSFENRFRFPVEIVQEIKRQAGADFPVSLRYSVVSKTKAWGKGAMPYETDFVEFGRDMPESEKAVKYLEDAGYDMFNCDNGTYDAWYWAHPPQYMPDNCNLEYVEHIKQFTSRPVVCAGRMDPVKAAEEIAAAETATGPTESLQKENGETGFTLEHTLGDYDQEERMVEYAALREALRQLPERERQVIALRFYHGLTQQRAAGILHISQVQVSRLERRAVERLREWLAT